MLLNDLKVAFRNFMRHKTHTLITLFGLSTGMACTLLILLYVNYEMSYDGFQLNKENLYRVNKVTYENGELNYKSAYTFSGQGPVMKSEIPEVRDYVRLLHSEGILQYVKSGDDVVSFREKDVYYADPSFFNLFSYRLIEGNAQSALSSPNSILLSESTAKRLLGSEDAIGKTVRFNDRDCAVTGVFEDIPRNSHLTFDALVSFSTLKISDAESWQNHAFYTYVLLKDKTNPKEVEPKLAAAFARFIDKYHHGSIANNWELQRVDKIYLYSTDFTSISMEYGNYKTVFYLLTIALLVLIIAWVNFINLSTARLPDRAKEIGIRRTVGASREQLARQFVTESILMNLGALAICLAIVESSFQSLNRFLGIDISFYQSLDGRLWGEWLLLLLIGICLTSLYPALWLTSIPTTSAITRNLGSPGGGNSLRKALITFQFAVSVALIIVTCVMYQQISFATHKDLGMNIDHVLVIRAPNLGDRQTADLALERLKQAMVSNPAIREASISLSVPGERFGFGNYGDIHKEGSSTEGMAYFRIGRVDTDFVRLFGLRLLAGYNFNGRSDDRNAVILNEEASKTLHFAGPGDAVGKFLRWNGRLIRIIGVVNNFHQESFHKSIEPIVLYTSAFDQGIKYFSIKLEGGSHDGALPFVEKAYRATFPGQPFDYFFLDDFFDKQYQSDVQVGKLIFSFAFLAILIAALGLYSLVSYVAAKRTKEIGIRKVVGASVSDIVTLLMKDFIKWVLIADLIAWPVAYYFMSKWLQDFAYRIELDWRVFILAGAIALLIALATLSYHAIKAATANPVEALRYE
jgi:putative ABC transport system permease protein